MHLGFRSGRQLVTKVVDGLRREDAEHEFDREFRRLWSVDLAASRHKRYYDTVGLAAFCFGLLIDHSNRQ